MTIVGWCAWAVLLILAVTNGVNFSDGLDGLAAGSAALAFFASWRSASGRSATPATRWTTPSTWRSAAAMVGACAGFLWWNARPRGSSWATRARSRSVRAWSSIALTLNVHLLLPIIGGLYVVEVVSVILQVAASGCSGGAVFRMAPIHHHFELGGWPETTILVRFWLLAGAARRSRRPLLRRLRGTGGLD